MKAYIITEVELNALADRVEKAFRQNAERHGQAWDVVAAAGATPTVYDGFRTANLEICRWKNEISQ